MSSFTIVQQYVIDNYSKSKLQQDKLVTFLRHGAYIRNKKKYLNLLNHKHLMNVV